MIETLILFRGNKNKEVEQSLGNRPRKGYDEDSGERAEKTATTADRDREREDYGRGRRGKRVIKLTSMDGKTIAWRERTKVNNGEGQERRKILLCNSENQRKIAIYLL